MADLRARVAERKASDLRALELLLGREAIRLGVTDVEDLRRRLDDRRES